MISTNFCIRVQLNNFSRECISQIVKRVYVTRINFILLWNDYNDYLKLSSANEASSGKNRFLTSDNTYQIKFLQKYSEYPILRTAHCFSSNRRVSRSNHDVWLMYDNALIRRRTEVCTFPESGPATPTVSVDLRSEN